MSALEMSNTLSKTFFKLYIFPGITILLVRQRKTSFILLYIKKSDFG